MALITNNHDPVPSLTTLANHLSVSLNRLINHLSVLTAYKASVEMTFSSQMMELFNETTPKLSTTVKLSSFIIENLISWFLNGKVPIHQTILQTIYTLYTFLTSDAEFL